MAGARWSGKGSGGPEGDPVVRKGVRWSGRGPVVRKGDRWSGKGAGGPEGGPVVRKGARWSGMDSVGPEWGRWSGKGAGGPERGPVVQKGARWSRRGPGDYVEYIYVSLDKITVKFILEQATKVQRWSSGIALLFL